MDASNLILQYHRLLKQADLPRKRIHDLRHTCATLLLKVRGKVLRSHPDEGCDAESYER